MAIIPLIIEYEGLTGRGFDIRDSKNYLVNELTNDGARPEIARERPPRTEARIKEILSYINIPGGCLKTGREIYDNMQRAILFLTSNRPGSGLAREGVWLNSIIAQKTWNKPIAGLSGQSDKKIRSQVSLSRKDALV